MATPLIPSQILRTLLEPIRADLEKKIILLSGPRQVGKTFLSRKLFPESFDYFNYDRLLDRKVLQAEAWNRQKSLLICDEVHKMHHWKRWLKGVYDTEGIPPRLLATGSARLDIFRRGGDSLAGRHHSYRLHPFSVAELKRDFSPEASTAALLRLGGFPEPFLSQSEGGAQRWRKSHLDRILKEDLIELENIRDLKKLEWCLDLLSERVGSTLSYASLAKDLELSPHTVKKWIQVFENFFITFTLLPYSKNIARSILKEPKIYFLDGGRIFHSNPIQQESARMENLVACALLKRCHFLEDTQGDRRNLHYLKDKTQREVDFLTTQDQRPEWLIEVKKSDAQPSSSLIYYTRLLQPKRSIQLVFDLKRELHYPVEQDGKRFFIEILKASEWLAQLET